MDAKCPGAGINIHDFTTTYDYDDHYFIHNWLKYNRAYEEILGNTGSCCDFLKGVYALMASFDAAVGYRGGDRPDEFPLPDLHPWGKQKPRTNTQLHAILAKECSEDWRPDAWKTIDILYPKMEVYIDEWNDECEKKRKKRFEWTLVIVEIALLTPSQIDDAVVIPATRPGTLPSYPVTPRVRPPFQAEQPYPYYQAP